MWAAQEEAHNFDMGMGPIELKSRGGLRYAGRVGPQETAAQIAIMAERAVSDAQEWLVTMIEQARANAALSEQEARTTFVDPMVSLFCQRSIRYAHPEVQQNVTKVIRKDSSAVHEAKKRRTKQVISCSFPCGKWLHMIGARTRPGCELCKRERKTDPGATNVPVETVAHIQSAGCKAQKKSVIGAHNRSGSIL